MAPFTRLTALAAPLLRDNVDTDAIIPSREMKSVTKTGLSDGLFAGWRYRAIDSREPDSGFILNDPRFAGARILLAGRNFGCGSSREHAVWALAEFGFRAIIAPSFSPIFRGNCVNNGIVPVELDEAAVRRIAASLGDRPADHPVTVDLRNVLVTTFDGGRWAFDIDAEAKEMLLSGLDAIEFTLLQKKDIEIKRRLDAASRPWVYL